MSKYIFTCVSRITINLLFYSWNNGSDISFKIIHLIHTKSLQSCPALCNPMDCVAHQAPLFMGFSRQEYWWVARPSQRIFPTLGSNPVVSLIAPALAGRFFSASAAWEDPSRDLMETLPVISSKWCVSAQTAGKEYSWSILTQEPSRGSLI